MKQKILIIEDNLEIREDIAELLEFAGYDVITADDGISGLQLAKDLLPDLVVCDIGMKEMDGYGVLTGVKRNLLTSQVAFLFCTARSDKKDAQRAKESGVDTYLVKPFSEAELLSAVETCMHGNRQMKYC